MKEERLWMRMDGRNPSKVLHYNYLEQTKVFKRKDDGLWVPVPDSMLNMRTNK